ncbi:MAG: LPS export ABC transporter ATP-binding protein [bacterium]
MNRTVNNHNFERLEARCILKSFNAREVVKGVSLRVNRGEVVGLLGPNGAGKTTTFNIIIGHTKPDSGDILLNEMIISDLQMYKRARLGIGYLPQESSIFRKLTVEENIMAILETTHLDSYKRKERLKTLLEEFNLIFRSSQKAGTLSGGERRRLEITRTLAISPIFILLDEPFAGIDPIAVDEIQSIIARLTQQGIGIIITDHNVRETLEITNRSYIIYNGYVMVEGTSDDLINDPEVRKLYLGDNFTM